MTTCHRATYARPKPYSPKASTPSPRAMATWIARPSRVDTRIPAPARSTLPAKALMAGSPRSFHELPEARVRGSSQTCEAVGRTHGHGDAGPGVEMKICVAASEG